MMLLGTTLSGVPSLSHQLWARARSHTWILVNPSNSLHNSLTVGDQGSLQGEEQLQQQALCLILFLTYLVLFFFSPHFILCVFGGSVSMCHGCPATLGFLLPLCGSGCVVSGIFSSLHAGPPAWPKVRFVVVFLFSLNYQHSYIL